MLQSLLYFFIISFFCFTWGLPIIFFSQQKETKIIVSLRDCIFLFFSGLCVLSIVSSWLCVVGPIKYWQLIALTIPIIGVELFWIRKGKLKFDINGLNVKLHFSEKVFLVICLILFYYLSAGRPQMVDTDLYHLQSIKWISEYGTIPGLANIYLRFGFYSNWFHLISLFNFPFANQNFLYLNNALCIWTFFFLFFRYKKHSLLEGKQAMHFAILYFLLLVYSLYEWRLFRSTASSTSYDFIVTTITIIIICLLLEKAFQLTKLQTPTFLLLLASVPFFKITGIFLFVFLPVYFLLCGTTKKQITYFILIFLIAFFPYLYKNYMQTGYPFFPYNIIGFQAPDWQVPLQLVYHFNKFIYLTNHYINQSFPADAWTGGLHFSYINDWFLHLTMPDKFMVALSLAGGAIGWVSFKKVYPSHLKKLIIIQAACYPPLIICLVISPDTRFVFGFLLMSSFIPISILLLKFWRRQFFYIGFILISFTSLKYVFDTWSNKFETSYLLKPPPTFIPPFKTVRINNFNYNTPEFSNLWSRRCFGIPLPCLYQTNGLLVPRGSNIKMGFRMNAISDSSFLRQYQY